VFFQILVVVRDEALNIAPDLVESVRSLGAGRRALYWYVYIPASSGAVLTAWRVSVGTAVAVLFIAETTATREGLGYYIINNSQRLRYPEMYAGILAMSVLGVGLYMFTDVLERVLRPWKRA
jgi:NitT/TauT family transport system permease protein